MIKLFLGILVLASGTAFADNVALNESNWSGVPGEQYWVLPLPGDPEGTTYCLDIEGDTFFTTHKFAIKIQGSNIVLDGQGKTITGNGPPTVFDDGPNSYGIRVNAGGPTLVFT